MVEESPLDSSSTPTSAPTVLPEVQVHIDVAGGEIGSAFGSLESISVLSAFTMLESMSLTEDAELQTVFFYDRECVRYKRIGEEGQYTYEPITSILEGNVVSSAISGGMLTPIANNTLQKVVDFSSPP